MDIKLIIKFLLIISSLSSVLPATAGLPNVYRDYQTSFVIRNDTCVIIDETRKDCPDLDMSAIVSTCRMTTLPSAMDGTEYYSLFTSVYPLSLAFWNIDIEYIQHEATAPTDTIVVTLRFPNLKGTNIAVDIDAGYRIVSNGEMSFEARYDGYNPTNNSDGITINPIFDMGDCIMGIFKGLSFYFMPVLYELRSGFDVTVTLPNITDELLRNYFLCAEQIYIKDNTLFFMGFEYPLLPPMKRKPMKNTSIRPSGRLNTPQNKAQT